MYAHSESKMTRRNGSVIKYIVFIVMFLGVVYFIYLHNKVNEKLKDTERTAERYRREQESCSSQLQDLSNDKEELRTNCDRERKEFENRLSSLQQQHKMLKTQNDDLQAEYSKLNLDLQKDKEEQKQVESQRNQEYMQLKQEKELELTSLKDQLANLGREKQQLAEEVNNLRTQLQNAQQQYQAQLQAQQAQILQQQQGVQQGQGIVQQAQGNIQQQAQGNVQQQAQGNIQQQPQGNIAQQQPNVPVVQGGAVNDQQANAQIPAQPAQGVQEMQQAAQVNQQPADNQVNAAEQAKLIEENQQQHQVQPPNIQDKEPEKQNGVGSSYGNRDSQNTASMDKVLNERPNIQPPNLNLKDVLKHGKGHYRGVEIDQENGKSADDKESEKNHQVDPPGREHGREVIHQVAPPGGEKEVHQVAPPGGKKEEFQQVAPPGGQEPKNKMQGRRKSSSKQKHVIRENKNMHAPPVEKDKIEKSKGKTKSPHKFLDKVVHVNQVAPPGGLNENMDRDDVKKSGVNKSLKFERMGDEHGMNNEARKGKTRSKE